MNEFRNKNKINNFILIYEMNGIDGAELSRQVE